MSTLFVGLTYNTKDVLLHYKLYNYDMMSYPLYIYNILLWFRIHYDVYLISRSNFISVPILKPWTI
jgi:hypothetical protein